MKIIIACPAVPGSRSGNRVTAMRWKRILERLGHQPLINHQYDGEHCDLLIALHARRSHDAMARYRSCYPRQPLILALTGTDLYRDIRTRSRARRSLEMADRFVVLQPRASDELPLRLRDRVRVIYQSCRPVASPPPRSRRFFDVCVLGHLRHVKDPFRAVLALRGLPQESRLRLTHAGRALERGYAERARQLEKREPRYRWLGEVPGWQARRILARSHLLVLSSRLEGGANVISEAVVNGTPVLASRIPGSLGLLGDDYEGFFRVGVAGALTALLQRAEFDHAFYERLSTWCSRLRPLFDPEHETASWRRLLEELSTSRSD